MKQGGPVALLLPPYQSIERTTFYIGYADMKKYGLIMFSVSLLAVSTARAADKYPIGTREQFLACSALQTDSSYEKKYDGFKKILVGKDGWYFRSSQDLTIKFKVSEDNLALLKQLTADLKARGTDLIIAYPPTRGIAAASYLPDGVENYNPAEAKQMYVDLAQTMNKSSVNFVVLPAPKSGAGFFYKADLHWTSEGAMDMAQAVAAAAKKLPSYKALKKIEFYNEALPDAPDEQKFAEPLEGICNLSPEPEMATLNKTVAAKATSNSDDLFVSDFPQVVLVGTSNSNRDDNDMNFSGRLKEFLSADVYNAAVAGGGLEDAMLSYLASKEYKENPPKLIVWEIPGYYNLNGDETVSTLRRLIPAVYGSCQTPLAEAKNVKLESGETDIFGDLLGKIPAGTAFYLGGNFSQPENRKISIVFRDNNNKSQKLKMKKFRKYPSDNSFYYAPPVDKMGALKSVSITVPEHENSTLNAQLCTIEKTSN